MESIKHIRSILNEIIGLKVSATDNLIVVLTDAPNGYDVTFEEAEDCYIVSFGQWNEYLPKDKAGLNTAVKLLKFGLSDSCQLELFSKGDTYYKCILRYRDKENDNLVEGARVSRLIYPFWKNEKTEIQTFQNQIIVDHNLGDVYKSIKHDRKKEHYKLNYFFVWLILFFLLNRFDVSNIQISLLMFFPIIAVTLFVPLFAIGNWFEDRKYGKKKKTYFTKREKRFLLAWLSLWALGFLISLKFLGSENVIGLTIILFPFMIVGFFIPIYLYLETRSKGKRS